MMFQLSRLRCAVFIALGLVAGSTARAAEEPLDSVKNGTAEVMVEIYDNAGAPEPPSVRLRPVLKRRFDFEGIARRAIGPGWRSFTPEQRQQTIDLLSELVLRSYADRFDPKARPQIQYGKPIELSAHRMEMPTTISYEGQTYSVSYRIELHGDAWLVYDVIIEGVSMVSNYRSQFDELVQRGGPEGLLRTLQAKLESLSKEQP